MILVALYIQNADDSGFRILSSTKCCWFWLQWILKYNVLMILLATYNQARCAKNPGCNEYSNIMCWWFLLQRMLKENLLMILVIMCN